MSEGLRFIPFFAVAGLTLATACQPTPDASAAAASSLRVVEFKIPRADAFPHDPAVGKDGSVWYTDQRNSYIGRLDPATGNITDIPTPTPGSAPHGIVVAADGGVWYTEQGAGKLGHVDPATNQITEYELPAQARDPHTPLVRKGMVWFTVQGSNMYGRFDPATRQAKVWAVPTPRSSPYGIVNAPDGSIWIALFGTNKLGRINAETGELTEIKLPESGARPRRLAVDETGVVWYTDYARGRLGSYNPKTGVSRDWLSPGGERSGPYGIAIAPDGRIFYDEERTSTIVAFTRKSGAMEKIAIPTSGATVRNMSVDSARARVWLALSGTGRIGRIDLR